jgi:methionyl-tRNA formyltransferase
VEISEQVIAVATSAGTLILKEIQIEGKKRMPVEEFIKGKTIKPGDVLSSEK